MLCVDLIHEEGPFNITKEAKSVCILHSSKYPFEVI